MRKILNDLRVDFHCRRDVGPGIARFLRGPFFFSGYIRGSKNMMWRDSKFLGFSSHWKNLEKLAPFFQLQLQIVLALRYYKIDYSSVSPRSSAALVSLQLTQLW